ncbi:MAG: aminoacyl-tRNA hydrolase [Rickettsiales bacterium]|jgi:PTH1 family peptidyl-tRNA hydrolase|nr:aminoacyl-tRNA hydrolase [Rickettsiales bacterium]
MIVGLGNPGPEYSGTRHNAGFMAAEAVREAGGFPGWKARGSYLYSKKGDCVLVKPQTFMNLSGRAVLAAVSFYKPDEMIVLHDDLDLPVGSYREKTGGGNAGHNGLRSIDEAVGSSYRRVRIGISHPRGTGFPGEVSDYVLAKFSADERKLVDDAIGLIAGLFV